MAPFHFRLQQVLDYRKQLEEQATLALAEATAKRDAALAHLRMLAAQMDEQRERLSRAEGLSAAERWLAQTYVAALREESIQTGKYLTVCEEQVDLCRVDLVKKAQEHELLCKLKEKQALRHAQQARLSEQREYDETATLRFKNVSF